MGRYGHHGGRRRGPLGAVAADRVRAAGEGAGRGRPGDAGREDGADVGRQPAPPTAVAPRSRAVRPRLRLPPRRGPRRLRLPLRPEFPEPRRRVRPCRRRLRMPRTPVTSPTPRPARRLRRRGGGRVRRPRRLRAPRARRACVREARPRPLPRRVAGAVMCRHSWCRRWVRRDRVEGRRLRRVRLRRLRRVRPARLRAGCITRRRCSPTRTARARGCRRLPAGRARLSRLVRLVLRVSLVLLVSTVPRVFLARLSLPVPLALPVSRAPRAPRCTAASRPARYPRCSG